jgi:hypothetical protein
VKKTAKNAMAVEYSQDKISRNFNSSQGNNYEECFILGCDTVQLV